MNKAFLCLSTAVVLSAGCTLYPYTHKPPEKITINNEKYINKPLNKAWSNVSSLFFNDTFKLETTDKASGTLVATFQTDRPINYIDCGIVKRKYRDNEKVIHEYTYNYADSTKYTYEKNGQFYDAEVKTDLTTEITAKVTQLREGSNIAINTLYTLNREVTSTNQIDGSQLPPEKEQIKFTTTEPYKTETFSCISLGTIEHNILYNLK